MKPTTKRDYDKLIINGQQIINEYPAVSKEILTPKYSTSGLGLTPRQVTYWRKKELFLSDTPDGSWHRFNLIESVWIKLLFKLKTFNYSIKQIKKVKEVLAEEFSFDKTSSPELWEELRSTLLKMNNNNVAVVAEIIASEEFQKNLAKFKLRLFDCVIQDIVILRNQYRVLIDENGDALFVKKDSYELFAGGDFQTNPYNDFVRRTHLTLNLNELVASVLNDISVEDQLSFFLLDKNELDVLSAMKEKDVKHIEVNLRSDTPLMKITKEEIPDAGKRIEELILSDAYQEIKVITQKGKIVHCQNTEKRKLIPKE